MIELFLVFLVFGFLGLVLILMNKFLGPTKTNPAKESPFECGSPYLQEGINPVPIKFYLVAFLFLLFDIEVVFFLPWAVIFRQWVDIAKSRGVFLLIEMAVFIGILLVGYVYVWKKGALEWE